MTLFQETKVKSGAKNTGQCLTHLNKHACDIWSCFGNVQF